MTGYCKHCQCSHSTWMRLNNAVICGRCGSRERDLRVRPSVLPRVQLPQPAIQQQRQL